jgi:exodeoxyribonuclease V alpha subunit
VPAQTVHRLLGIRPKYGRLESRYHCEGKDGKPPFPADVLIVDEAGMLDAYVFEKVLYAVRDGTRVVLVGDPDQLPPVGPGVPLLDTLQAMLPPHGRGTSVARLTVNHRQGPGSQIPNLAAQINSGSLRVPQLTSNPDVAVDQVPAGTTARQLGPRLVQLAAQYGGTWGAGRPWPPVLVLNPTRDEVADLNRQIQAAVNPGTLPFRVGDPVLQAVNNYEAPLANQPGMTTEVMNGEMGRVVDVQRDAFGNVGRVVVEFDAARVVEYDGQAAEAQLLLAYAMTVHKAQGTEADVVIVPVLSSMRRGRRRVWNRRLLYTAVTRARQRVVIVTDDPAEVAAVARLGGQSRRTRYRWMVRGVFV